MPIKPFFNVMRKASPTTNSILYTVTVHTFDDFGGMSASYKVVSSSMEEVAQWASATYGDDVTSIKKEEGVVVLDASITN